MKSNSRAKSPREVSHKWQRVLSEKKKRRPVKGETMKLYKDIADGCRHFWSNRTRAEFLKTKDAPL